jgi:hypothetical protein
MLYIILENPSWVGGEEPETDLPEVMTLGPWSGFSFEHGTARSGSVFGDWSGSRFSFERRGTDEFDDREKIIFFEHLSRFIEPNGQCISVFGYLPVVENNVYYDGAVWSTFNVLSTEMFATKLMRQRVPFPDEYHQDLSVVPSILAVGRSINGRAVILSS